MASEAEAFDSGHQASEWKWLDLRSALRIPALLGNCHSEAQVRIAKKTTLKWVQFPRTPSDSEYAAVRSLRWRPLPTRPHPHLAQLLVLDRRGDLSRPDVAGV